MWTSLKPRPRLPSVLTCVPLHCSIMGPSNKWVGDVRRSWHCPASTSSTLIAWSLGSSRTARRPRARCARAPSSALIERHRDAQPEQNQQIADWLLGIPGQALCQRLAVGGDTDLICMARACLSDTYLVGSLSVLFAVAPVRERELPALLSGSEVSGVMHVASATRS